MPITVTSSAFNPNQPIPKQYTCDGKNYSPPLAWTGIPQQTKSIVVLCDDPDAPNGRWVHWVVFNLPPNTRDLPERVAIASRGGTEGTNSFGKSGWGGPCPPSGSHRYFFIVYAVDVDNIVDKAGVPLKSSATAQQVRQAIEGHIVAQGELMGTYERKQ